MGEKGVKGEAEVEGINRAYEGEGVATTRANVMASDRAVRRIGARAFEDCRN